MNDIVNDNDLFEVYAELVAKFKSGDESAYEELYTKTQRMVYSICLGILRNEDDAFDAMQDTYLTVYRKIGSLEDDKTFISWLKRIATTKSLDLYKKRKGDVSYDDAVAADESLQLDDDLESLPDAYIMEKTKREALDKIIKDSLTDVQYQTIHMHYYSELPVETIAGLMNCPVGTVKTRLMTSRAKIKEGVKKYEKDNKDAFAGAPAVPFLTRFFNANSDNLKVPNINISNFNGNGGSGISTATKTVAKEVAKDAVKKGFLATVGGKLLTLALIVLVPTVAVVSVIKAIRDSKAVETTVIDQVETTLIETEIAESSVVETEATAESEVLYSFDMDTLIYSETVSLELDGQMHEYTIPQIDLDSDSAASINSSILRELSNGFNEGYTAWYQTVEYRVFWVNDSVFSLVISYTTDYWDGVYRAYTFDALHGTSLTNAEILELAGLDDDSFCEQATAAVCADLNSTYEWMAPGIPMVVDGAINEEWVNAAQNSGYGDDFGTDWGRLVNDHLQTINPHTRMFLNANAEVIIWQNSFQEREHFLNTNTGATYTSISYIE